MSYQVQFRIKTTDPLFAWIMQIQDSGESVSEAVRSSLRSQLSQNVSSTYYPLYQAHMLHAKYWRAWLDYCTDDETGLNNMGERAMDYVKREVGGLGL